MGTLAVDGKEARYNVTTKYIETPTVPEKNGLYDKEGGQSIFPKHYPSYGSTTPGESASLRGNRSYFSWLAKNAWLLPLVHTEFWISAAFALIQPFFPVLASSRGLDSGKYSFVFSCFKLSMFLGSAVTERLMKKTSPTLCYLLGQGGFFVFTILFGCLYWIPGGNVLLGASIVLVLFGGFMNSSYLVSMFAVLTDRYSNHSGLVIGFLEFLWGVGNMVGSAFGGALIDIWDFPLAFFVIGAISILSFPIIVKLKPVLDQPKEKPSEDMFATTEAVSVKYRWLLLDPIFLADMLTVTMGWVILGFNEPTLEPSLRDFNLTNTEIGSVFTVQYASYSVGCIIAGIFCHFNADAFYAFIGQALTAVAYLLIGPAPFMPFDRSFWMIYVAEMLIGLGMAAQFICAYSHALLHVIRSGYPNSIRTNAFVSSSVFTFMVSGGIVTPPVAGYLVQYFGYQKASSGMFLLLAAWTPVTFFLWMHSLSSCSKRKDMNVTTLP